MADHENIIQVGEAPEHVGDSYDGDGEEEEKEEEKEEEEEQLSETLVQEEHTQVPEDSDDEGEELLGEQPQHTQVSEDSDDDGESVGGSSADAADAAADEAAEGSAGHEDDDFVAPDSEEGEGEEEEEPVLERVSTVHVDDDGRPVLSKRAWEDWASGVVFGVRQLRKRMCDITSKHEKTGESDWPVVPTSAEIKELARAVLSEADIVESEFGPDKYGLDV